MNAVDFLNIIGACHNLELKVQKAKAVEILDIILDKTRAELDKENEDAKEETSK